MESNKLTETTVDAKRSTPTMTQVTEAGMDNDKMSAAIIRANSENIDTTCDAIIDLKKRTEAVNKEIEKVVL
jgi:hypothetical protein